MTNDNGLPQLRQQEIGTEGQEPDPPWHNGPYYKTGFNPSNWQHNDYHQIQTPWETQTNLETRVPSRAQLFQTSGGNSPSQWVT